MFLMFLLLNLAAPSQKLACNILPNYTQSTYVQWAGDYARSHILIPRLFPAICWVMAKRPEIVYSDKFR